MYRAGMAGQYIVSYYCKKQPDGLRKKDNLYLKGYGMFAPSTPNLIKWVGSTQNWKQALREKKDKSHYLEFKEYYRYRHRVTVRRFDFFEKGQKITKKEKERMGRDLWVINRFSKQDPPPESLESIFDKPGSYVKLERPIRKAITNQSQANKGYLQALKELVQFVGKDPSYMVELFGEQERVEEYSEFFTELMIETFEGMRLN